MDKGRLERLLDRLTARQQERVRVAFASFEEGLLTSSEFVAFVTSIVVNGNARGYALGAALARSLIERQVRRPQVTPVTPAGPRVDEGRVATALGTILATDKDTLMQLTRLAGNEAAQAAADGQWDVIVSNPEVDGYERDLEADACGLCRFWAAESHKFSPTARFPRHTNCACGMSPITKEQSA